MTEAPASRRRFLTIEQVAEDLSVSDAQIRSLLRTGELRGIRVGTKGLWRIGINDLEDFIAGAYRQAGARIAAGDLGPADSRGTGDS
jgi:excisionase family DNA binding protein